MSASCNFHGSLRVSVRTFKCYRFRRQEIKREILIAATISSQRRQIASRLNVFGIIDIKDGVLTARVADPHSALLPAWRVQPELRALSGPPEALVRSAAAMGQEADARGDIAHVFSWPVSDPTKSPTGREL